MVEKSFLTRMLDEIERLRNLLTCEHASTCAMLREDVACNCGCVTEATAALMECSQLRGALKQAEQMLVLHRMEIARLDTQLNAMRAKRSRERLLLLPGNVDVAA